MFPLTSISGTTKCYHLIKQCKGNFAAFSQGTWFSVCTKLEPFLQFKTKARKHFVMLLIETKWFSACQQTAYLLHSCRFAIWKRSFTRDVHYMRRRGEKVYKIILFILFEHLMNRNPGRMCVCARAQSCACMYCYKNRYFMLQCNVFVCMCVRPWVYHAEENDISCLMYKLWFHFVHVLKLYILYEQLKELYVAHVNVCMINTFTVNL